MAPTILLVEDDAADAAEVTSALADMGAAIWHAETGADARAVLKGARPDLIMLDLTLPDVDGLVLCANLENEADDVPFMICSVGSTAEKVLSFKLGAEDFVTKPFDGAELQARVEAILMRHARQAVTAAPAAESAPSLGHGAGPELGRLRVDLARWRVTIDDKPLNLTPTEFQLLVFMARRPGEIISRQELARGVWGNESMSRSRTIDAYVRRIASKLSGSQKQNQDDWPPRILNIRGMGYQLSVPHMTAA
ncbi:MAG: response regulator transcription factor [Chloroflexi bacterium]|nr:response regulator transcription factor [Chloroflexota bacterium]MBV9899387.1 response regulator transcription factor [Chloroflexota bacterium]